MTKLFRTALLFTSSLLFYNCSTQDAPEIKTGIWRGTLALQDQILPFLFEVEKDNDKYTFFLLNGDEKLLIDDVIPRNDSVEIVMHIFDTDIKARVYKDSLVGIWTKNYADNYRIPFKAIYGDSVRFPLKKVTPTQDFTGQYNTTFIYNNKDTTQAIAVFNQTNEKVTGTFITPTGDYRFLEGNASGNTMMLSTFDGDHAFLFAAVMNENGILSGGYWSGKTWYEQWIAYKDDNISIADIERTATIKEQSDKFAFSFPDLEGNSVSLQDEKYKNKVVILQLFGTWCPNCMDETKFLKQWYDENSHRKVEIIGLAYETKDDYTYAKTRVEKMRDKLGVAYDLVIAGTRDKKEAAKTLPQISEIISFPTTIFIDKQGKVRKIHNGFVGPGTGNYYVEFVEEFNNTVDQLIAE